MNDAELFKCNETELLAMARRQGLGALRRGIPKQELIEIVTGYRDPVATHYAGTQTTRAKLELFIVDNWGKVRSQLPGCNGRCTTFNCSEGKHVLCFAPNKTGI